MSELFLIAHKCRGEPALDIATQMPCPECEAQGCSECDNLGWWWIIPTSGHRAYAYWYSELGHIINNQPAMDINEITSSMPPSLPDHYPARAEPTISLAAALGLTARTAPPPAPIHRRF